MKIMEVNAHKKNLKDELANGLDDTFKKMEAYLNPTSEAYNTYLLLRGSYKRISNEYRNTTLDFAAFHMESNKISRAVLQIIDELVEDDLLPTKALSNPKFNREVEMLTKLETHRVPTPKALHVSKYFNSYNLVVGDVIEVVSHPNLNNKIPLGHYGWDPFNKQEIRIENLNKRYELKEGLKKLFEIDPKLSPPNNRKFCFSNTEGGLVDEPSLRFEVQHSDFFTLRSFANQFQNIIPNDIIEKYGNLYPFESNIPHSVCVHYLVLLDDGHVICQQRSSKLAYHPSKFSFTQEEQLGEEDFHSNFPTLGHLMIRALCEEIFPLSGNKEKISNNYTQYVQPLVQSIKIWSFFLEVTIFNYGLLGVIQLNVSREEYIRLFKNYLHVGTIDREADLYSIDYQNIEQLIFQGEGEVKGLFNDAPRMIDLSMLHPSSLYRIFKLVQQLEKNR